MALIAPEIASLAEAIKPTRSKILAAYSDFLVISNQEAELAVRRVYIASGRYAVLRVYWRREDQILYLGEQDPRDLVLWARHDGRMMFSGSARMGRDFYGYARIDPGELDAFFAERANGEIEAITFWDGGEHIAHMLMTRDVLVELTTSWELAPEGLPGFCQVMDTQRVHVVREMPSRFPNRQPGVNITRALPLIRENLRESGYDVFSS
ncbi:MAG: hypothetical protein VYE40_01300 [Myxococcota bacterium]|nr:hypothetical protein [Myxococcota bacterium]